MANGLLRGRPRPAQRGPRTATRAAFFSAAPRTRRAILAINGSAEVRELREFAAQKPAVPVQERGYSAAISSRARTSFYRAAFLSSAKSRTPESTAPIVFCRERLDQPHTSESVTVEAGDASWPCENPDREGTALLHSWGRNQVFVQTVGGSPLRTLITAQIDPQRYLLALV